MPDHLEVWEGIGQTDALDFLCGEFVNKATCAAIVVSFIFGSLPEGYCQTTPQDNQVFVSQDEFCGIKLSENPSFEGSWREFPTWLENVPFDLAKHFQIDDSVNRESEYLRVLLDFDVSCFSAFPQLRDAAEAELIALMKDRRELEDAVIDFYLETVGKAPGSTLDSKGKSRAIELLEPFEVAFVRLKAVQQKPSCFMHQDFGFGGHTSSPYFAARQLGYILALKCNTELESGEAVKFLRVGLRLQRDLVRFGELVEQMSCVATERICLDSIALPILRQENLQVDQLNELLTVLKEHREQRKQLDLIVESAKREFLAFQNLFHLLETNQYATVERASRLGMDGDALVVPLLLRELDYSFYGINTDELVADIKLQAASNDRIAEAWQKVADGGGEAIDAGSRMMLGSVLAREFTRTGEDTFLADKAVLRTRYEQVVAATRLPFPGSTERLMELEENWTLDESWKQTKLLRWLEPIKLGAKVRRRSSLYVNAYLCLAACRAWQLNNHGQMPESLSGALKAIGIMSVPRDPYSGRSMLLSTRNGKVKVYSVGPDGTDDRAKVEFDPSNPELTNSKGDIVFSL